MANDSGHGGKRKGAGRKPMSSQLPLHIKKLRASSEEWEQLLKLLQRDSRRDFKLILAALKRANKNGVN